MGSDRGDNGRPAEDTTLHVYGKPDNRLTEDPRPDIWSNWQGAVLLKDEIEYYSTRYPPLITPFKPNQLESAAYKLSVGENCRVEGEDKKLGADNPLLVIPKHGAAIIQTRETLILPAFLIGRWNLKVKKVYLGLLWSGGARVDPGYYGTLFCPVFNFSHQDVELRFGETLFAIDFVRTTRYDASKGCDMWQPNPDRNTHSVGALDERRLRSSVKEDLDDFHRDLGETRREMNAFQGITFVVIGILVSVLAILMTFQFFKGTFIGTAQVNWPTIGMSATALLLSVFSVLLALRQGKANKKSK